MTPSAILYAAADYMREHGFSPELGYDDCRRCFLGALRSVAGQTYWMHRRDAEAILYREITGHNVGAERLRRDGWNADDAVAALTIAADIAFEDERARGLT